MAVPLRSAISKFGPANGSSWTGLYPPFHTTCISSATTNYEVFMAPPISINTVDGAVLDALPGDGYVCRVSNIWVVFSSAIAVNLAGLSINFNLYRAGSVIGGDEFSGWGDATGGTPAFAAHVPVVVPWDADNTALAIPPNASAVSTTAALLPMKPNDVISMEIVAPASFVVELSVFIDVQ